MDQPEITTMTTAEALLTMLPGQSVQTGWIVESSAGPMYWPVAERAEALTYCEDGAEPVATWAKAGELEKHQAAQGFEAGG